MLIKTNLNAGYYILVKEALRENGKKIAKAKVEKDIDSIIEIITNSQHIKRELQLNIARARKYTINPDGSFSSWL